ncbi:hypothetical protein IWX47DRAFT_564362 [Phyllosticta citricarpa]
MFDRKRFRRGLFPRSMEDVGVPLAAHRNVHDEPTQETKDKGTVWDSLVPSISLRNASPLQHQRSHRGHGALTERTGVNPKSSSTSKFPEMWLSTSARSWLQVSAIERLSCSSCPSSSRTWLLGCQSVTLTFLYWRKRLLSIWKFNSSWYTISRSSRGSLKSATLSGVLTDFPAASVPERACSMATTASKICKQIQDLMLVVEGYLEGGGRLNITHPQTLQ